MNFNQFWISLMASNPALSDGDSRMTMSVKQFKIQMEKAYHAGELHGERSADRREANGFDAIMDVLKGKK